MYLDDPEAAFYPSHDIDVLVPPDRLEAAIAALQSAGYAFQGDVHLDDVRSGRTHHVAPLYPPGEGWFVEVHAHLVPPKWIETPTDWAALESHLVTQDDGVYTLDPFATALNAAVHGYYFIRFRDVIVAARALAGMSGPDRDSLRMLALGERREGTRLYGFFAFAARLAGDTWPADRRADAYLRWIACREDMPLWLRWRSQIVEMWYASGGNPLRFDRRFYSIDSGSAGGRVLRVALAPAIAAYAALMGKR